MITLITIITLQWLELYSTVVMQNKRSLLSLPFKNHLEKNCIKMTVF